MNFLALTFVLLTIPGADGQAIVATVGGEPIRAGEVERLAAKATRGKKIEPEALPYIQAQVLEEFIARRLVLAYAQRTGAAPTAEEMQAAQAQFKAQLKAQRRSLADYLKTQKVGEADIERQLAWNVVWEKYLARYATEERLESYFAAHRRDFDGTELAVSHILLRPSSNDAAVIEQAIKQAEAIREEINAGKLSFADAARKHSAGPSGKDGGRLGVIGRHGPMDESFSRAAFALKAGEMSRPVRSPFGVHLIRCDEVKPGNKMVSEVRKELEAALARELLEKLADLERKHTAVDYTGALPHFKPGTRELAGPRGPASP